MLPLWRSLDMAAAVHVDFRMQAVLVPVSEMACLAQDHNR